MADRKISELSPLVSADVSTNDVAPVADISANEARKVTVKDFAEAGYRLSADGAIPLAKVEQLPNTLDGSIIMTTASVRIRLHPTRLRHRNWAMNRWTRRLCRMGPLPPRSWLTELTLKLLDGSITTSKIGNQQVTNAHILDDH